MLQTVDEKVHLFFGGGGQKHQSEFGGQDFFSVDSLFCFFFCKGPVFQHPQNWRVETQCTNVFFEIVL